MDLLTCYSRYCGTPIPDSPPDYPTNYIHLPDKYISVHTGAGHPSRVYDYWNKVFNLLDLKLPIAQVGINGDSKILNAVDYIQKTSIRQGSFIIENSLCHIGCDSLWLHIAGMKNTPLVGLYNANPLNSGKPHYYHPKSIFLESHRNGNKPSYSVEENSKTINLINPEDIAEAISQVLDLGWKKNIKTKRIGQLYLYEQIDYIPDFPFPKGFENKQILCRMDLCYNEKNLVGLLEMQPTAIKTNKPINANLLEKYKGHIAMITYLINNDYNKDFIKTVHNLGVPYQLITKKVNNDIKLDLIDFNGVELKEVSDFELSPEDFFESQRGLFSGGKFFPSVYHLNEGITFSKCQWQIGEAAHSLDFKDSLENFYIYSKI